MPDMMQPMQGGQQGIQPADPSMQGGAPPDPTQQQPMASAPQQPLPGIEERDQMQNYMDAALQDSNLAKHLKDKKGESGGLLLDEIGQEIQRAVKADDDSRTEWIRNNEDWLKLAMLVRENRTYPWPKASNVKYPLVATAAMQFSARAYPALVPSDGRVVKTKLISNRTDEQVYAAAERVATHMSFQVMERMPNWEEDMDKLLMTMAITGLCFKKTYYSSISKCNHSHIVYPENLIVNYYAKSLEKAYRKTEVLQYTKNEVQEKVNNNEEFLDVELPDPTNNDDKNKKDTVVGEAPPPDNSTPFTFWSCHTFWDLDDDGYEEPYVITIHKDSGKVVRIIARWDGDGVTRTEDKKTIIAIRPIEYFTDFPFIPNPDGSIYAMGFGMLLGPLNESVNTIINQLVDAGTLANMQSGFIGKGLRLKMGQTQLRPGEWQVVNATGDDLHKAIYPLPVKEPSGTLFQLMNMLIQSGNQLASIAEIFVGKMPGQNTPATTTQETVQQSMAVFTAIYKRVYRSLAKEFKKIYRLNRICPEAVAEEQKIAGMQMQASDYDLPDWVIVPGADPTGDSMSSKLQKLQMVGSLINLGTVNPQVYTKMFLDANEIPGGDALIVQPPPPQPDPKMQTEQMKQQTMQMGAQLKQQASEQDMQIKERIAQLEEAKQASKLQHERQLQAMELQGQQMQKRMDTMQQVMDQHFGEQQGRLAVAKAAAQVDQADVKHKQAVVHKEVAFRQKQHQDKQQATKKGKQKGA